MGTEFDYRRWFSDAGLVLQSFEDLTAHVRKTWTVCVWRLLLRLVCQPQYLRFLLSSGASNRIFAVHSPHLACLRLRGYALRHLHRLQRIGERKMSQFDPVRRTASKFIPVPELEPVNIHRDKTNIVIETLSG